MPLRQRLGTLVRSIRFGLAVIAVCGLVVLAAGIRAGLWAHDTEQLAVVQGSLASQLLALEQTAQAAIALEGSQRGYLLAGAPDQIVAYQQARRDLDNRLRHLEELAQDAPIAIVDIAAAAALGHAVQDQIARSIERLRDPSAQLGLRAVQADEAKQAMAPLRERLELVAGQLRAALAQLSDKQAQNYRGLYILLAVVVVVVELLIVVALVSLSVSIQRMRQRQRAEILEAMHDPLTKLPNRRYLGEWLTMALAGAARSGQPLILLYVDLDGFKSVNDRFGHAAGDRVLQVTADRLRRALRTSDFVARLGGDEFVAVLPNAPSQPALTALIERLQSEIAKRPIPEVEDGLVRASLGIARFPGNGDTVEALLAAGDRAMYEAKQAHRRGGARRDAA